MIMAGRPPIDLNQRVRDLLTHTVPLRLGVDAPIRNFEERTNACFNLIKYIDDHVATQSVYRASYDRHMSLLHRMVLVSLVETFERFIKETAVVCVDAIAPVTIDNRFDQFSPTGGSLAGQFISGSIGKAMCESDTWLSNQAINDRFRNILKPHFGEPWNSLFPNEKQNPNGERARASTLSILWQVRHNITHNTGVLTDSDARRLTLMIKMRVNPGSTLNPDLFDLRYVKRFLVETADHTNNRIGRRLAELLTERYQDDSTLFDPQVSADSISKSFQQSLTIAGRAGTL
jgi:hypothetical protein